MLKRTELAGTHSKHDDLCSIKFYKSKIFREDKVQFQDVIADYRLNL